MAANPHMIKSVNPLQPGVPERIGKYPVLRELGQGATSRVFHPSWSVCKCVHMT